MFIDAIVVKIRSGGSAAVEALAATSSSPIITSGLNGLVLEQWRSRTADSTRRAGGLPGVRGSPTAQFPLESCHPNIGDLDLEETEDHVTVTLTEFYSPPTTSAAGEVDVEESESPRDV